LLHPRKGTRNNKVNPLKERIAPITATIREKLNTARDEERMAIEAITMDIWSNTSAKSK
jgi:hypothetical protein